MQSFIFVCTRFQASLEMFLIFFVDSHQSTTELIDIYHDLRLVIEDDLILIDKLSPSCDNKSPFILGEGRVVPFLYWFF